MKDTLFDLSAFFDAAEDVVKDVLAEKMQLLSMLFLNPEVALNRVEAPYTSVPNFVPASDWNEIQNEIRSQSKDKDVVNVTFAPKDFRACPTFTTEEEDDFL